MRYLLFLMFISVLPATALGAQPTDFKSLVTFIIDFINNFLIVAIIAITFLVFLWGVVRTWIFHGDDPKEVENGKHIIFVSIIALVVISSLWGIVELLKSALV
jgi:hypothetical protein